MQADYARVRFHCGDTVCDVHDPVHVGRLEAVRHSSVAKIRWHGTGWVSEIPLGRLRKAEA